MQFNISNCTITNNQSANSGGALYCAHNSNPFIINSIFWGNEPQEIYFDMTDDEENSVTVAYSDICGGQDSIITSKQNTLNWLSGNMDLDPFFQNLEENNLYLSNHSPCIDAGTDFFVWNEDTVVDFSSNEYTGAAPDMGAFEYDPSAVILSLNTVNPKQYVLFQNYPNPFNPSTNIVYHLANAGYVKVTIYDMMGREVKVLVNQNQNTGKHSVFWNGTNQSGNKISSGVYLCEIKTADMAIRNKMLLVR